MEKILLIDGHSILHRAFYGVPELTNAKGLHTNAIFGFLNIIFKILEEEKPQFVTVAFDVNEPTFRHEMFPEYKGTRKPMPEELREQVPVMKDVLRAMSIQVVEKPGFEADDVLGTLARLCEGQGMQVSVLSGDRDLLQLATKTTKIRIPKTKRTGTEIEDYLEEQVVEKYQVTPSEFIDVKALMGDASDNIPGVPGVGEKTATKLIVQYHSVDGVYAHIDEMKASKMKQSLMDNQELALLSRKLAEICTTCELEFDMEQARIGNFYTQEAYRMFQDLEFKNMLGRFGEVEQTFSATDYEQVVEDIGKAETVFREAATQKRCALVPLTDEEGIQAVALMFGKDKVWVIRCAECSFINSGYLADKCKELCRKSPEIAVYDCKELLGAWEDEFSRDDWAHLSDIGLLAYLADPLKSEYVYDELASEYGNVRLPSKSEILGKKPVAEMLHLDREKAMEYGVTVAYALYHSMERLKQAVDEAGMLKLYEQIELPLAVSLYRMERAGIAVRKDVLQVYSEELSTKISQIQSQIFSVAGEEFNINSPKQLGDILFEKMQLPHGKKTKTGYSTSADVLDKLKGEYEVVSDILEYRQLSKLKSTYADGLVPCIQEDGRIHSTFQQKVTATGRISSTEPNLQNIPIRMELGRLIRKAFVPAEGCMFIDADYSQIELRVLAHMSGDDRLIDAFNSNQDIHAITASEVFHVPLEDVTPLQRRNAKAVNFGIVYGISAFGLSEDLNISKSEATEYIEKYFVTYPKIKAFLDGLVTEAKEKGYAITLFDRRRPVPELHSSNFMTRSFGERVAMNSPIQGTAADIIKIAMAKVDQRMQEEGLQARLVLQVHDELLIECPQQEEEQVRRILKEEMQQAADMSVRLEIDMHTGMDWYEAK